MYCIDRNVTIALFALIGILGAFTLAFVAYILYEAVFKRFIINLRNACYNDFQFFCRKKRFIGKFCGIFRGRWLKRKETLFSSSPIHTFSQKPLRSFEVIPTFHPMGGVKIDDFEGKNANKVRQIQRPIGDHLENTAASELAEILNGGIMNRQHNSTSERIISQLTEEWRNTSSRGPPPVVPPKPFQLK